MSDTMAYTGNASIAANGKPCRNWEIYSQSFGYTLSDFPDGTWDDASNKCRYLTKALLFICEERWYINSVNLPMTYGLQIKAVCLKLNDVSARYVVLNNTIGVGTRGF